MSLAVRAQAVNVAGNRNHFVQIAVDKFPENQH